MRKPIRTSLIAAGLFGTAALVVGSDSAGGQVVMALAVFSTLHFLLLLTHHLFADRPWRLTQFPAWTDLPDRRPDTVAASRQVSQAPIWFPNDPGLNERDDVAA